MAPNPHFVFLSPVAAALASSACVSSLSQNAPLIEDSRTFNAPFGEVWTGAVQAVLAMAMPIKAIEKESGVLATDFVSCDAVRIQAVGQLPQSFLEICQGRYTLSIFVRDLGDNRAFVRVTTHVEAYEMNVAKRWYPVHSKGVIEAEFLRWIESSLGAGEAAGGF